MEISTKAVKGGGMVIGSGMVSVPRKLAEENQVVPSAGRIERAKASCANAGLSGASILIDAIQMLETPEVVVGYFGFTLDKEGLTRKPLEEGETDGERGMKIMRLPHPQWGNRKGTATTIGDLVTLAESLKPDSLTLEQQTLLSQVFEEAAAFLSQGSSEGEA
ncbi:MAG: hypothetical protein P4M11_09730 [Candidatus Pacebacteria bacterium]|nr:hypothetical protein [Candidatus Paceibacterota bacterium]